MSEQVLNQFRSDKKLREDCVEIYESMGMDLNTAFRMFMERTRMSKYAAKYLKIWFELVINDTRLL